jgi:hypothetical protein
MNKNILNYMRGLLATTIILLMGSSFFSSCNDEEEKNTKIVLNSFGPAGVKHGDMIKFIGLNLDKVTSIVLPGVEVNANEFATRSSNLIELTVPQSAEAGKVILKTPEGDIETKTPLDFEVPVVISSITPEARPGANISIKGTLVNWIEEVTFSDEIVVTEFVSKTLNEVVVKVPIEAQTGFLIFGTGGTEPLSFASDEELIVTLPAVTSINPEAVRHTSNLSITGTDLDLVTSIVFQGDLTVTNFVSQSSTEIVVAVPAGALKGRLTLKQASPVDVVTTQELKIILPIGTAVAPKPAVPGTDNITITGTDLDLVAELTLPSAPTIPATSFISQSTTQIVLAVPVGAKSGGIAYKTIHGYSNNLGVSLIIPAPGPTPLAITLYDETMAPGGGDWSWDAVSSDPASTEQFYSGDVSWKYETNNGGGASSGGMNPVDVSGQGVFVFSLYGGPGTEGAQVAAILGDDSGDEWGSYNTVTLKEGKWTEYRIPLTSYATVNLTQVKRWILKVEGITSSTIYVDRVGFDPAGPPPLSIVLYDDTMAPGGGDWSWNKVVSDPANAEQVYSGNVSWKFETNDNGGVSSGGITALNASGTTYFSFSVYGGPGTNGKQIACILNDNWNGDNYNSVALVEGQWTAFKIPITDYPDVDFNAIVRWALKVEGMPASVIYVDRIGFE